MADNSNQGGMPEQDGGTPQNDQPVTFEAWLGNQDDAVKGLIDTHVSGLKSALDGERAQRKELANQLKTLSKDLEKGSQARDALESLTGKMEQFEQQLAAYDALSTAGVTNLKLAYIAAREAEAIRKDGTVNLETLKAQYPELFKKASPPPGDAGAGTGNGAPSSKNMNDFIRAAAGRT